MTVERDQPEKKPLTMFVCGGGTLYQAHCPELDITYYDKTPEKATQALVSLAKGEVKGILEGRGELPDRPDERKPLAESLAKIENLEPLFEIISGPGPIRPGLK